MGKRFGIGQIIDRDKFNFRIVKACTDHVAADAAETINCDFNWHVYSLRIASGCENQSMKRLTLSMLLCGLALAQHARSVSGSVKDAAGNMLPGTVVQCENTVTLNVQSYITREDGDYSFRDLSSDVDFVLRAHYKRWWSKPVTLSKFNEKRQVRIDLVIPVD